jgi:small subunit ribosomal protein S21
VAINVKVQARPGESSERLIRRFNKKVKRERALEEYRAKTDHYIKPSVRKKLKSQKARREKMKLQRKLERKMLRQK